MTLESDVDDLAYSCTLS